MKCTDPKLKSNCTGCTDRHSEGTHQGCTKQHGHVGCDLDKRRGKARGTWPAKAEKKPKLRLEVWKSSMNQEERHFFLPDAGPGYQRHMYVFGYNPEVISEDMVECITALIEMELEASKI